MYEINCALHCQTHIDLAQYTHDSLAQYRLLG